MSEQEEPIIRLTNKLLMTIEEERKQHPSLALQEVINAIWFLSYSLQEQALESPKNNDK